MVGVGADDGRGAVVAKGGGEDLGGARGLVVDEEGDLPPGVGPRLRAGVGEGRAAGVDDRDDGLALLEEEARGVNAAREVAPSVAA